MSRYRPLSDIDTLVIHCAGTPNGEPVAALTIDKWHYKRGFRRALEARLGEGPWAHPPYALHQPYLRAIGYHFVIAVNGSVSNGRRLTETGAHAIDPRYPKKDPKRGRPNRRGIGICLIGTDRFSREQWDSLAKLVSGLRQRKEFTIRTLIGHRDLSPDTNHNGRADPHEWIKLCPGFEVRDWVKGDLKPLAKHTLYTKEQK